MRETHVRESREKARGAREVKKKENPEIFDPLSMAKRGRREWKKKKTPKLAFIVSFG